MNDKCYMMNELLNVHVQFIYEYGIYMHVCDVKKEIFFF